ncbi:hypothetical protein SASPL_152516 [Salvia splendens]|uniref:MLO-like protein n=1 Tax=Salvia splendens TaxID=180675 RepID=A0A8X8Z102_SALSN|nr:hypothetical protein SASPL_152516 [Salvia splendens]
MSESEASENDINLRSLALTPTWSVASVLTMFVFVSLLVERSIHQLGLVSCILFNVEVLACFLLYLCYAMLFGFVDGDNGVYWLKKTDRKPLLAAVEKMKEAFLLVVPYCCNIGSFPLLASRSDTAATELMLLGFISLLLTASSSIISNICIPSKFYDSAFAPCTKKEVDEETKDLQERGLLMTFFGHCSHRRMLMDLNKNTCSEACYCNKIMSQNTHLCFFPINSEPFVSYEGLEQLHRFIFVMAITHVSYSCLTMLLAIGKLRDSTTFTVGEHGRMRLTWTGITLKVPVSFEQIWFLWPGSFNISLCIFTCAEKTRAMTLQRQSTFVRLHTSTPMQRNNFFVWVVGSLRSCMSRSILRASSASLGVQLLVQITLPFDKDSSRYNHNLTSTYDFHSYMIRSMEEEFQRIVGVSAPLWGFVVAFMLFNVKGFPSLLLDCTYSCHQARAVADLDSFSPVPGLLLLLDIHNSFELTSFFWFWLACSGINIFEKDMSSIRSPNSSFIKLWLSHKCHNLFTMDTSMTEVKVAVWLQVLLHKEPLTSIFTNICWVCRAILVQLQHPTSLCISYTGDTKLQSSITRTCKGTNYKAALIPRNIRDTIHGWGKAARRRRKMGTFTDDSTIHPDTSTVMSVVEDDHQLIDSPRFAPQSATEIELQQTTVAISDDQSPPSANEGSTLVGTPLLHSASVSSPVSIRVLQEMAPRSSSMPQ